MHNPCLDDIVSISSYADGTRTPSVSGLDLMDAPEINLRNLNNIATSTYTQGLKLARAKMDLAITLLRNDFIGALQANKVIAQVSHPLYDTADFRYSNAVPASTLERGINLYKSKSVKGRLTKHLIEYVEVYPLQNADNINVLVYDNNTVTSYPVTLVANQINTFKIDHLVTGKFAQVLIDNTDLQLASTYITCKIGCNGSIPNACGHAKGWDGTKEVKTEGFGLNVQFKCICDYDQILCDLSKGYIGQLIWLKTRFLILDEQIKSNRFNDFIIYDREESVTYRDEVNAEYVSTWNNLMAGLYGILETYGDSCLNCRGIKWVTNI